MRDSHILNYPSLVPAGQVAPDLPLLFSDSPETPSRSGVLYQDRVRGTARVVAYHVNGLRRPARLLVLARNTGGHPAVLTTLARGSAVTPGPDPLIGQQTLLRYFASAPLAPRPLNSGQQAPLFDSGPLSENAVVSVMLDVSASAAIEIRVVLLGADERPGEAALPVLARDLNHQRGTFAGALRTWSVHLDKLPARLVLGGQGDPPLRGVDALTGTPQELAGNFGVLYDLHIVGARGHLLALSPRGGAYRGALRLWDGARTSLVLLGRGRALLDPAAPDPLWRVSSDTLRLHFVPANGSNLPVALVFYPGTPGARGR